MAAEIEDPFGDDLNDLPTENFQIGLERDGQLHCLLTQFENDGQT